jgi:outer membrane protein assembly factor BamB
LTLKRNKRALIRISFLLTILFIVVLLLTGCVRGMTPIGWSGIAIQDDIAYTGSKEGRLVSVNLATTVRMPAEPLKVASAGGGFGCATTGSSGSACGGAAPAVAIYGTPALSNVPVLGDLVYIAGYNGKVFAYDAGSLQQRWVFPVEGNISPVVSSVVVSGNTLYFGGTDGLVYALDTSTGALKWTFGTGGEIWASPAIQDNTLIIGSFDKKVYALDATTGEKKWEFVTEANNVATPLIVDGIAYVGSLDRNLYALNLADGNEVWRFTGENWFWARPVDSNGMIFAPCLDNFVYVLDAKTGNRVTQYDVQGQTASWPVTIGEQVIVATQNGFLWSLNSADTTAAPRQVATIPEGVTSPLAAEGETVYINSPDNRILGYNVITGASIQPISLSFN